VSSTARSVAADGSDAAVAGTRTRRVASRSTAFLIVGFTTVVLLVSSTVPSPMYVIYQQRWHFSPVVLTMVFGIYALAVLVSMLLFGSLSDTAGRRRVLSFALIVVAVAMVLFATAGGVTQLLVARAVQGIGVGIATSTLGAALIELSPSGPARGMQVNAVGPTTGMALGALGAGLLVQYGSAPTVLSYLILLAVFVICFVAVQFIPETAPGAGHGLRIVPRRVSVPGQSRRQFAVLALTIVSVWAIGGLYLSLGPSLVAELLHSRNHVLGGLVVTLLAAFGAAAQLTEAKLTGVRPIVIGTILLLVSLGAVALALSINSAVLFFVATAVLGFGWGSAFFGSFRAMAALADPARRGELIAAIYVVAYLAMSVPSIIAGAAVRSYGLLSTTEVFIAVVALLVVFALLSLPLVTRHPNLSVHRLHLGHRRAVDSLTAAAPAPCAAPVHEMPAAAAN
jgi:MFS family permease